MSDMENVKLAEEEQSCPLCKRKFPTRVLEEAKWMEPSVLSEMEARHPGWQRLDGACPACVQEALLTTLLKEGEDALHDGIQSVWPLDAEAAFGALPTPLRMHADPRFTGRGVTIAFIDSGFYPHPDLIQPRNRIKAWVDVSLPRTRSLRFKADQIPKWPGWEDREPYQWHGLMTSGVAAGNGWLSHGLYRGLASDAELVLIQVLRTGAGKINDQSILRGLRWLIRNAKGLGVQIVNVSLGGDRVPPDPANPVDNAVEKLIQQGITVVCAAGNEGQRHLVPPASAPMALTVGGIDDKNVFDHREMELWHSNYGETMEGASKPELVAPSIWVAAPMLPGTPTANEAAELFTKRAAGDTSVNERMAAQKLVTPHYQHVDGTSFAAPLTSSVIACMLEANPELDPKGIRAILKASAVPIAGAPFERQGSGVLEAGQAVAFAVWRRKQIVDLGQRLPPLKRNGMIQFYLYDPSASKVQLFGSWDEWKTPIDAIRIEDSVWKAVQPELPPGRYFYKFLLDGSRWMDDPANPHKAPDASGFFNSILTITD
jgi:serine protease AprX